MGWDFTSGASRQDIVRSILEGFKSDVKVLGHASTCYGRRLWVTVQTDSLTPLVCLYLLDKQAGYGWGYKDMDESMHPYYYDCPLKLLLGPGTHNQQSINWRAKVNEYHKQKKKNDRSSCS